MYDFIKIWDLWHYFNHASDILRGKFPIIEYPPLALLPMIPPRLLTADFGMYSFFYHIQTIVVILLGTFFLWRLVRQRVWRFLVPFIALFPLAIELYDPYVVVLTLGALLLTIRRRYILALALLSLATAMKLYPVVLFPLLLISPANSFFTGIFAALGIIGALINQQGLSFHLSRGIQPESIAGSLLFLRGLRKTEYAYNAIQFANTSMPFLVSLGIFGIGTIISARNYIFGRIRPSISLWYNFVLLFIISFKVFSPQYLLWLAPFAPFISTRKKILYLVSVLITTWYLGFYDLAVVKLVMPYALLPVLRNLLLLASLF